MPITKLKTVARLAVSLAVALVFAYGYYGLVTYAMPLSQDNFRQARTSLVSDDTELLLNGAAKAYKEKRYEETVKVLELALEKLLDKSGRYRAINTYKLERVYFLLGKAYQMSEKPDKAIQSYEDTLRLNPEHRPAKYNLEMLQQKQDKGGDGKSKPQDGQLEPQI